MLLLLYSSCRDYAARYLKGAECLLSLTSTEIISKDTVLQFI